MAEKKIKAAKSPLPWKVGYSDGSGGLEDEAVVRYQHGLCITDADDDPVVIGGDHDGCSVGVLDPDDAEFIVEAVNAYKPKFVSEPGSLVTVRLIGPEVNRQGRRYAKDVLEEIAEQAPGKLVYDRTGRGTPVTGLSLSQVVGEVGKSVLEDDGQVFIEIKPLTEIGKVLARELEAGRARVYTMGRGNPETMPDGADVVGKGYEFIGVGIEQVKGKDDGSGS